MAEQRLLYIAGGAEHTALDFRQLPRGVFGTNGVLNQTDLQVIPRGLGANMSVDVTSGRGHVDGYLLWSNGTITADTHTPSRTTIDPAPSSGNERIDSVQARITDAGDGTGVWQVHVAKGTVAAIGSAVAPSVPSLAIELARVRVPAGTSSIQASNITDRRVPAAQVPVWSGDLPAHAPGGTVIARGAGGRMAVKGATRWVEMWSNPDLHTRWLAGETTVGTGLNQQLTHLSVDLDPTRNWKVRASYTAQGRRSSSGDAVVDARLQAVNDVTLAVERNSAGIASQTFLGPSAHFSTQIGVTLAPSVSLTRIRVLLDVQNNAFLLSNSNLVVEAWPA